MTMSSPPPAACRFPFLQQLFRGPLNVLGDRAAVIRSWQQRAQNQKIEGTPQELDARRRLPVHYGGTRRKFDPDFLVSPDGDRCQYERWNSDTSFN